MPKQPMAEVFGHCQQEIALCDDARNIADYLPDKSVSLIVTSLPCVNFLKRKRKNISQPGGDRFNIQCQKLEQYSQDEQDLRILSLNHYKREMTAIFGKLLWLLEQKGHCVVNVPDRQTLKVGARHV